jgi:enoyl-CoA hydratase/carnithine racemase
MSAAGMETKFCRVETDGRILTVTIDRPEVRNALSQDASWELGEVFDAFDRDPELWIAIVTGAGDKAFCAGADLKGGMNRDRPPVPPTGFGGMVARHGRLKPVIAAVNGQAMGGGFELALACDLIVAADTATFGLTEPRVGLAALGGGIQRLIREIGSKRAMALLLTARKITAGQAADLGLVNEIVPAGELMSAARRWADEILQASPNSVIATKAVANALDGRSLAESMTEMFNLTEVRRLLTGPDAREGPKAFAEKRPPVWSNPE